MAKVQNMNKRVLAIVLAIVFVLTVVPTAVFVGLRGKADPFYSLQPVQVYTKINGVLSESADTTIQAGVISDNISNVSVNLPEGAEFVKAILLEADGKTETEIAALGHIDDADFYSLYEEIDGTPQASDLGTALKEGQKMVLVYAKKYSLNIQKNGNGSYKTSAGNNDYIYAGESLRVYQLDPDTDYKASSIQYSTDYTNGTINIQNGEAVIPATEIVGDLRVIVNFNPISSYAITDLSLSKGLGNGGIAETQGNPIMQANEFRTRYNPENVAANGTKTFFLYSASNTGGSEYVLNMLRINGVEIEVSGVDKNGATGELPDGTMVSVQLSEISGQGMYWLDNKPNATRESQHQRDGQFTINGTTYTFNNKWNKTRTIYEITVSNVHSNLSVEYNFKQKKNREMIIKDLGGISETAAAKESTELASNEYYFIQSKANVYKAYYNQSGAWWRPSANLYLYRVKPGFNPYNITADVYYVDDEGNVTPISNQNLYKEVGLPEYVIKHALADEGNQYSDGWQYFDSSHREWGYYSGMTEELANNDPASGLFNTGTPYVITSIGKNNNPVWYAVGLHQNSATNQQLWLNVKPYDYHIQLSMAEDSELNESDANNYLFESPYLVNKTASHINDEKAYMYLPSEEPTREGYYFKGWQQVDESNHAIGSLLQPGARINITDETIDTAIGDVGQQRQFYRFVAEWDAKEVADKTKAIINVFVEDPINGTLNEELGKKYTKQYTNTTTENVGKAVVLNNHCDLLGSSAEYYTLNMRSDTVGNLVNQTTDDIPNTFNLYYDYKLYDLVLENTVLGYPTTTEFDVTVVLTPDENSPFADISLEDAQQLLISNDETSTVRGQLTQNNDGDFIYKVKMKADDKAVLTVPFKWSYSVNEAQNPEDYKNTIVPDSGIIKSKTVVDITNMQNNAAVDTEKTIKLQEDGTYTITLKSWATGKSYLKPQKKAVDLDIALVVDQSATMGTADMDETILDKQYKPVEGPWTIEKATSKQYYYRTNDGKFYPVKSMEGVLYQKVDENPYVNAMFGKGHDGTVFNFDQGLSNLVASEVHYGVPTDYYALDSNGKAHKVYLITVGENLRYTAYPYYYTDSGLNEEQQVNAYYEANGEDYTEYIRWMHTSLHWEANDLYKTTSHDVLTQYEGVAVSGGITNPLHIRCQDGKYVHDANKELLSADGSEYWRSMAYNGKVCFVGQDDASIQSADAAAEYYYEWYRPLHSPTTVENLYLPIDDAVTYNQLGYVDSSGVEHSFTNPIYVSGSNVYSGTLYELEGTTRVTALKQSVSEFVDLVAQNAKDTGAEHRMAIIGFAGNKVPIQSEGSVVPDASGIDTTKYDYTNTGLFVNNDFLNYEKITSLTKADKVYINKHYYTSNGLVNGVPTGNPVRYFGSQWMQLTNNGWVVYNGDKYEPSYENGSLSEQDYKDSLVIVRDDNDQHMYDPQTKDYTSTKTNGVNDKLDKAISQFGNYGGAYTSYGMAMANNMFANTVEDDDERQRVIIVFTSGEPGANGYDEAIAREAIADSNKAKNDYNAKVFTIGISKNDSAISTDISNFMNALSSEEVYKLKEVEGGAQNKGELDANKAYYYTGEDGKTYSVSAIRNGEKTLGWWLLKTVDGKQTYQKVTPMSETGAGSTKFYQGSNERPAEQVVETEEYNDADGNPIRYEYRWYDSNNGIKNPVGTDNPHLLGTAVQFYDLVKVSDKDPSDTTDYYLTADNINTLAEQFSQIVESLASARVSMELGPDNSLMKDIITDHFDASHAHVSAKAVEAKSENGVITETGSEDNLSNPDLNGNTVVYQGFDYSSNYIGDDRQEGDYGKKLVVTIENLVPLKTGWALESNTNESGVYERQFDEDDHEIDPQMLQAFEIPKVNRPSYTLVTDGDDTDASYTVKLKLVDKDGNVLTQDQWERLNDETPLSQLGTPDTDGFAEWISTQSTGDADEVRTDTVVLEDVFRDLPEGYKVYAKVSKTGADTDLFTYSLKLNNSSTTDGEDTVPDWDKPFELAHGDEIEIDSARETVAVNINEVTIGSGDADYSDPNKDFDVVLTLKDTSNRSVNGTFNGVTFTDGEAVIKMRNGQTRIINIPKGYSLEIDVDKDSQAPYTDSYKLNGTALDGSKFNATTINDAAEITVINTIDAPIPTGMSDNDSIIGILLGIFGTLSLAGGAGYVVRKRKNNA